MLTLQDVAGLCHSDNEAEQTNIVCFKRILGLFQLTPQDGAATKLNKPT